MALLGNGLGCRPDFNQNILFLVTDFWAGLISNLKEQKNAKIWLNLKKNGKVNLFNNLQTFVEKLRKLCESGKRGKNQIKIAGKN